MYDRQANRTRNPLLFVDPKVELTQGKQRITLADLGAGQRVVCAAEQEVDQGSRLVVFEIRLNERPK